MSKIKADVDVTVRVKVEADTKEAFEEVIQKLEGKDIPFVNICGCGSHGAYSFKSVAAVAVVANHVANHKSKVYLQSISTMDTCEGQNVRIERMALHKMEKRPPYGFTENCEKVFPFRVVYRYSTDSEWRYSCRGKDVDAENAGSRVGRGCLRGFYNAAIAWLEAGEES